MDSIYREVFTQEEPWEQQEDSAHLNRGDDQSQRSLTKADPAQSSERFRSNTGTPDPSESSRNVGSDCPTQRPHKAPLASRTKIDISRPIGSLCAAGGGGGGVLTVRGDIEDISDADILENREPEAGIRSIPRFRNYQPGEPSRVAPPLLTPSWNVEHVQ